MELFWNDTLDSQIKIVQSFYFSIQISSDSKSNVDFLYLLF